MGQATLPAVLISIAARGECRYPDKEEDGAQHGASALVDKVKKLRVGKNGMWERLLRRLLDTK